MTTTNKTTEWTIETPKHRQAGDYAKFSRKGEVFVRFAGRWEFYTVLRSGESRGLEMFAGYVERPEQIAVLERALAAHTHSFAVAA